MAFRSVLRSCLQDVVREKLLRTRKERNDFKLMWLTNRFWEVLDEKGCRLEIVVG